MDIKRLNWAIRRGMLELDLIFKPFLDNHYSNLAAREQDLFIKLLECEDPQLFKWFLKSEQPEEADIKEIVDIIRSKTGLQQDS